MENLSNHKICNQCNQNIIRFILFKQSWQVDQPDLFYSSFVFHALPFLNLLCAINYNIKMVFKILRVKSFI